ncbi:MAG: 4a-hydroxytetrahydrobiopterin dehydratase [Planctomycetes bacterium]|nr:4a-hydroxytetrahydrobiopterin dehydratase [Planctomycetota bacterium]
MASELSSRQCVPCRGGVPPLRGEAVKRLQNELDPAWVVVDEHHLQRRFEAADFREALDLTNRIGDLAENENHHPVICLSWGYAEVTIYTHRIDGLTESDFILAAKIDQLRLPASR